MSELGQVAVITDCEHKTAPACDPSSRYAWSIGTRAIRNGLINYSQARPVDEATYRLFSARREPAVGDLILAREAPVGDTVLVPSEPVCLGQRTVLVSPDPDEVSSRYLYHLLHGPEVQAWMRVHSEGSTVKHLNVRDIYRIPLGVLPPLAEQERIAGVLGAFDDLIETNRRLASDLEGLLFAHCWELAQSAPTVRFDELATRVVDRVKPGEWQPGTTYLGLEHFGTDGVGLTGLGSSDGIQSSSLQFQPGDVLYGKLRPYFRKVARPGFSGLCSAEIWVLRANPGHSQAALHAVAQTPRFSEVAMAGNSGTKMPRADWDHIAKMQVPDLREVLTPEAAVALDLLWATAAELHDETADLTRQRDELLPLLMSGKVRVEPEGTLVS